MIRTLLTGLVSGSMYSLIASGLVLTYSATGVFNLGYGGVAFSSAFTFYELNTGLGWNRFVAAAFVIVVFAPLLGLVLDSLFFRPLVNASDSAKVVVTVGVLVALPALTVFVTRWGIDNLGWGLPTGDDAYLVPGVLFGATKTWEWGPLIVNSNQIAILGVAVICAIALAIFLRSPFGLRMRAVVDRPELAEMRGIDQRATLRVASVIGTMLAAIAGVFGSPILNSLQPGNFTFLTFVASTAVALASFRSVGRAFAGGLLVGVLMSLTFRYVDFTGIVQFNNAIPFILLLVALLALGQRRVRRTGTSNLESPPTDWYADLPRWRRVWPWALSTTLLVVWSLFIVDEFWLALILRGMAYSVILLSITVVTGRGGLISLAQAAFSSASALLVGMLVARYDVPMFVALVCGVMFAVALGVLVALPSLRLGGLAFTLATLALAFLSSTVLFEWTYLSNGNQGWTLDRPEIGPIDLNTDTTFFVVLLVIVLLVVALIRNLDRSAIGRSVASVRTAESAAASIGLSAVATKLRLLALSAAIAGLGGGLLAMIDGGVTKTTTNPLSGLLWITTVVLLGVSRPGAAAVSGLALILFPQILSGGFDLVGFLPAWEGTRSTQIPAILFGLGAAGLARHPDGVIAQGAEQRFRKRETKRTEAARAQLVEASGDRVTTTASIAAPGYFRATGLCSGYDTVPVLRDISLALPKGSFTLVLGPNGSGKTTLCRTLSGVIPVTSGTIELDDHDITSEATHRRARRGLATAPEGRGIFPGLTVDENLRLVLTDERDRDLVRDRFAALARRRDVTAQALSGGEQQMLTLAPFLARPPDILVADEPTLGLAPFVTEEVIGCLRELKERGTTVIVADEKPRSFLEFADQVVLMQRGRVVWVGTPDELSASALDDLYHLGGSPAAAH